MMRKAFLLLACLPLLILNMSGCQKNSSPKKIEKIKNTTSIVIGYGWNNYIAPISDQEEIKQLEDLFNGAEFTKSNTSIQQPYLKIAFSGEKSSTSFDIDDKDVIKLRDGNYIKSKQIKFKKLYSIYHEYLSKKK